MLVFAGCSGSSASTSAPVVMPGVLALSASTATVNQSSGTVSVAVTRASGSNGAVSVAYTTVDGTALAGVDYTKTSGTLTWSDGDASAKSIAVPLTTVPGFTGSRTFSITLSGVAGGATLGAATEALTITGSGAPGTISLGSAAVTVNQSAGTAVFTLHRTAGSSGSVSVNYTTSNGSAVSGTDYTGLTGIASWASGDASDKTVNVPVATTPFFSGTRTFTLTIYMPTGGRTLGTASSVASIAGTLIPPANLFSFSGPTYTWKEQLPIDQYGGTGGTNGSQYASIEESYSQVAAGFVDNYFYADTATYGGATNHVIFTAPSNGATTTPGVGSNHTRSELRELYSGTGADSNGDWNSNIGGTLTATCQVNSVSVNSDEATIGQIHNQSYVFALLLYRPGSNDIAFDLYSLYGGSAHVRTPIVTGVSIGTTVNYSIQYIGNTITVTVNGVTKTFTVDASWAGTPMYFKAGAYHAAPNTGNPAGDQTQVAFSAFSISH